ncbi:MAG: gliding motility-associated ABC transporter ATP-binding subunit GldA, partial [Sphingobacteriales bacterium]|nr:gliding motility-associated ABC transporter ATP-binding subunit GldA [Sphingobacteriales bacterium]
VEIREVIKQLGEHKTVLFSSHILQEVEAICDRVIIINKGTIVADDKLSILQKGNNEQHIIIVEFKENVAIEILQSLSEVVSIKAIQNSKFKIQNLNPESVRRQLLELSLKNDLNIVSLQSEDTSLEDIFRNLTSNINQ